MIPAEFEFEIQRLNENFKGFYSKTKTKVLANIVMDLPANFFAKCVDKILWSDRPPKIDWFHELVASYRKRQEIRSSIDQMFPQENSIFDNDTISMMKTYAFKRMNGQLSDQEYSDFQKTIREIVASKPEIKCKTCLDMGSYLPTGEMGIVNCPAGCEYAKS